MPTDRQLTKSSESDLYGIRKPKINNKTKEISSSTSLAFSSTLSSLLASSSSSNTNERKSSAGRVRPRKSDKADIFTAHNKNSLKRAARDLEDDERDGGGRKVGRQDIGGVDNAVLHRSKRKMEEKARLYAAMKRGDYVAGEGEAEGLIDFDRKWAENQKRGTGNELDTSSDDGGDSEDDGQGEMVEYEDEYGRMRRGTRAEKERCELNARRRELGKQELDRMAARPSMPENLIYGDTVQTAAFNPDEPTVTAMSELAAKRDRSATPPPATHYEADKEVRTKGQGFYSFSKDESVRMKEMESLEKERLETERVRREKDLRKERRKREIEERRKEIAEKRARKQADSFLEGLGADMGAGMGSPKESESVEEAKDETE